MNFKAILAYDGSPFNGWQVQPGLPTIQGTLAHAICHVTGESVLPQGSGRTDSGVHALAQVASFALTVPIPPENLHRALNRVLPPSIRILTLQPAPETFHARHSARSKTYEYRIHLRRTDPGQLLETQICSPFLAPFVWDCPHPLHLQPMQAATLHLLGTHDFTSFAATDPDLTQRTNDSSASSKPDQPTGVNPTKTIHSAAFTLDGNLLTFRITGSGFLHHMVRNLVGTLAEVGRLALPPDAIPEILSARDRSAAGPTAPASGLFLHSVHYEDTL